MVSCQSFEPPAFLRPCPGTILQFEIGVLFVLHDEQVKNQIDVLSPFLQHSGYACNAVIFHLVLVLGVGPFIVVEQDSHLASVTCPT